MSSCPTCQNEACSKDGTVGGRQCYRCKHCNHRDTVAYKRHSEEVKRQASVLYAEGSGFRSIGRLLNCSHGAVYQWIKQYGQQDRLDALPSTQLDVVEMDEMHSYIDSKKRQLAVDCR